jgi:hypothetical protein
MPGGDTANGYTSGHRVKHRILTGPRPQPGPPFPEFGPSLPPGASFACHRVV